MTSNELLASVAPLTMEQRQQAEAQARNMIAGAKQDHRSKFPPRVERAIIASMFVLLVFVFGASAIKVYSAASSTFQDSIASIWLASFVGVAFVVSSEIGQLVLTLMLPLAPDTSTRRFLWFGIVLCTAIPLVANSHVAGDPLWNFGASDYLWRVLATYSMPVLSLLGANVLKVILLHRLLANEAWQQRIDTAHTDSRWHEAQLRAYRDVLLSVNKRRKHGALLASLSMHEWRPLVYRELRASDWRALLPEATPAPTPATVAPKQPASTVTQAPKAYASGRGGNEATGLLAYATYTTLADGSVIGHCPLCNYKTGKKDSEKQAQRGLAAHSSVHTEEEKQTALARLQEHRSTALADEDEETQEVVTV